MTVLDLSVYDHSTFAPSCFAANGVERAVIGTSNYAVARDMVEGCRAAGIAVEDLYGFIYYGLSWESRDLDNCLRLAVELGGIKRIWLDCESGFSNNGVDDDTEAAGMTVQYRMAKTIEQRNRVLAARLQPGIYTGIYWWRSNMGDSHAFADLPLWLAYYGANDGAQQPITELGWFSFGGWTKTAAHQFASTIGLCGRDARDHNYWFLEEDMGLSKEDIVALFGSTERYPKGHAQAGELMTVDERFANAKARYDAALESGNSLLEQVGNALAKAAEASKTAGGKVPKGTTFTGVID